MEYITEFVRQNMNYFVLALPIVLGIFNAKRYNIIYGILSVFISAYFLDFILIGSGWINIKYINEVSGLAEAIGYMKGILVTPVINLCHYSLDKLSLEAFEDWFFSNTWYYFGFMVIMELVLHLVAHNIRQEKLYRRSNLHRSYC